MSNDIKIRIDSPCSFCGYLCFRSIYVVLSEQELSIQITNINSVQVYNCDMSYTHNC